MEENMIKVLINGCNGKMGQEVAKSIERNDNFETICGVDRLDTGDNKFPVYTNINQIKENKLKTILKFSVPSIIAMLLQTIITITDGYFIGSYVGETPLSRLYMNVRKEIITICQGSGVYLLKNMNNLQQRKHDILSAQGMLRQ